MTARSGEAEADGGSGRPGTGGHRFEVTGGALCLDLANTVDSRTTDTPKERLGTFADLAAWGEQARAIDGAEGRRLVAAARRHPAAAAAVLRRARTLREALFAIFSAVAGGGAPGTADLETLNDELKRALGHARLVPEQGRKPARSGAARGMNAAYRWGWSGEGDDLDRMLWPAARSAAELLTGDRLARVRECGAGNCAWLFLDTSRNRSRRWCDMKVCGNREKAHRHYRRIRRSR